MEDKLKLNSIVDAYMKYAYVIPEYINMNITSHKKAYNTYFKAIICVTEVATLKYLDDVYLNDVSNEFFTHQIYLSNNIEVGDILMSHSFEVIDELLELLLKNEHYEALINIQKVLKRYEPKD